jgi:transcriptional regulator with XRE-family HTH domain
VARHTEAIVRPELLTWARRNVALSLEEAAKKVRVRPERLSSWENGQARPTINQLRNLANAYKRPVAVFYLPAPLP